MRISDWSSDVCSSDLLHSRVPASHPFNPFGVTIGIDYRFKNTGLFTSYAQSHYRGVLGLRGKAGQFEWEVSGWQSRDEAGSTGPSGFDSDRSEEHTSELQSLMRISSAVYCLKQNTHHQDPKQHYK